MKKIAFLFLSQQQDGQLTSHEIHTENIRVGPGRKSIISYINS